jgi:DNA-directed RNA polymerase specialized sigma24 family protein
MADLATSKTTCHSESELSKARRLKAVELVGLQRNSILRRIHLLLGDDARKVTDTEEILSTALRRIDHAIVNGKMEAVSDRQFYAFMHSVIERSILEKARASRRLSKRELVAARLQAQRSNQKVPDRGAAIEQLALIGRHVTDQVDREVVMLRGRGMSFAGISQQLGMTPEAARKRWSRARLAVRALLEEKESNGIH